MIEAVNSGLANAQVNRQKAEPLGGNSITVSRPSGDEAGALEFVRAPYVSPYIHVNVQFDKAVLQIRDSETGDVVDQFPSEDQLKQNQLTELPEQAETAPSTTESTNVQEAPSQLSGESLFNVSQIASSAPENDFSGTLSPNVAQSQLAAATFNSSANSGQNQAPNVSVSA